MPVTKRTMACMISGLLYVGYANSLAVLAVIQKTLLQSGKAPVDVSKRPGIKNDTLMIAVSVTAMLLSEEPLMKRCISTGGTSLLFKPLPDNVTENTYQKIIEALGLEDKSPEDRVTALLTMSVDDLWQKIPPGMPLLPAIDTDLVPGDISFPTISSQSADPQVQIPGRKWCSALMIGESKLDVRFFLTLVSTAHL